MARANRFLSLSRAACTGARLSVASSEFYQLHSTLPRLLSPTRHVSCKAISPLPGRSIARFTTSSWRKYQTEGSVKNAVEDIQGTASTSHTIKVKASPDQVLQSVSTSSQRTTKDGQGPALGVGHEVRALMRQVPYPVAIITSTDPRQPEDSTGWRGATVSSFNTVTIEPTPIVSVNLKRPSSTFDAINNSEQFLVHLMNDNRNAAELAQSFTKGNFASPFNDPARRLSVIPTVPGQGTAKKCAGSPRIDNPKGPANGPVAFVLQCSYLREKTVQLGDHVVLFGNVNRTYALEAHQQTLRKEQRPRCLVYVDRQYGRAVDLEKLTQASSQRFLNPDEAASATSIPRLAFAPTSPLNHQHDETLSRTATTNTPDSLTRERQNLSKLKVKEFDETKQQPENRPIPESSPEGTSDSPPPEVLPPIRLQTGLRLRLIPQHAPELTAFLVRRKRERRSRLGETPSSYQKRKKRIHMIVVESESRAQAKREQKPEPVRLVPVDPGIQTPQNKIERKVDKLLEEVLYTVRPRSDR